MLMQNHAGGKPPPLAHHAEARGAGAKERRTDSSLIKRQRAIHKVRVEEPVPPHSPAVPSGLLNMDFSAAMGGDALKSMGPLGNMLGGMGLGEDEQPDEQPEPSQQKGVPQPSRRQKKRVVRVGR